VRHDGHELQVMLTVQALGTEQFEVVVDLDVGDWVGVQGPVVKTRRGELSVKATEVYLLGKALRPLPDKWKGLTDVELRSRQRELDLAVNPAALRALRARSEVVRSLRDSMLARGFLEVETPILNPVPGGALARPFVTHHNALDTDLYLRVASELYLKRLLVGGVDRVFELGRVFRNEGVDATHNTEFTMLESNSAFQDYRDMMELAREVIQEAADAVGGRRVTYRGREIDLDGDWDEVTMLDAVREAIGQPDLAYDWPLDRVRELCHQHGVATEPGWATGKLVLELYEKHAEQRITGPTFVTDYPVEVSPLAHPHRDNPFVTERFELIIGGREYANCFSELTDPDEQRARFEEQAMAKAGGDEEAMVVDEAYLRALELGLPPNAGLGIGVDRLVMLLADLSSIREALLFPQLRPEEV
jgi:lysyl-tRNA synthetase, class II